MSLAEIKSKLFTLDAWRAFFMGKAYPALVAALVLFGNLLCIEYYFNIIITGLFFFAMLICDSIRPALITVLTYSYQVSLKYSPAFPVNSDFYFSGWRIPVSIFLISLIVVGTFVFFFKNKLYKKISFRKTPLLLPLTVFMASLFLGGAFSDEWILKTLVFALLNSIVFLFLYVLVFAGFSDREKREELIEYFTYISLLISFILVVQMAGLYAVGDNIITDGSVNKDRIILGWGMWNLIGTSLAVLIPVLFLGAMRGKCPWLYFAAATLTWGAAALTMSRNALIFSSLAYGACAIIACFYGKNKRIFRYVVCAGALAVIALIAALWGKISALFSDYIKYGFSDNGRFELWELAIRRFGEAPILGKGFYGYSGDIFEYGPVPRMAHNTVLQLLSATGIVGLLSYLYYRVSSAIMFFKKPSLSKTMLGLSILVMLLGSMLDNFLFNYIPVLYYTVTMAIVCREPQNK